MHEREIKNSIELKEVKEENKIARTLQVQRNMTLRIKTRKHKKRPKQKY